MHGACGWTMHSMVCVFFFSIHIDYVLSIFKIKPTPNMQYVFTIEVGCMCVCLSVYTNRMCCSAIEYGKKKPEVFHFLCSPPLCIHLARHSTAQIVWFSPMHTAVSHHLSMVLWERNLSNVVRGRWCVCVCVDARTNGLWSVLYACGLQIKHALPPFQPSAGAPNCSHPI